MSEIRIPVIEIFGEPGAYAIQGEGKFAGTPSVFVRTFGCNLRCRFGLTDDQQAGDAYEQQIRNYIGHFPNKTLEQLPVFDKYCDTYYSIFPEYRKFASDYTPTEMFYELKKRLGNFNGKSDLVITGGEPLLPKYQHFWKEVFEMIEFECGAELNVTFETNGTYPIEVDFSGFDGIQIYFSISPKLKNSGQSYFKTIKPQAVNTYFEINPHSWFKFVVDNKNSVYEIQRVLETYGRQDSIVYLMPEGGTKSEIEKHQELVYNLCSKYGYCYSPRHQVSIKNNGIGI